MATISSSNPPTVRAPTGYSHGIIIEGVERRLIISGQVGMAIDGSVPTTGEGQIAQAFANLRAVLGANGMGTGNVVKTTIFLTDRALLAAFVPRAVRCSATTPRRRRCCSLRGWRTRGSWWRSRRKRWHNIRGDAPGGNPCCCTIPLARTRASCASSWPNAASSCPKVEIDLRGGENRREPFLTKNPSGQCPALELDDGG